MEIYSPNSIGISTGFGIPTGGTNNQLLLKNSSTNYDTTWVNYIPTGGTANQILSKVDGTNYNTQWISTNAAEYLLVGKLSQQTFVLGDNIITGFSSPTINTLGLSSWNSTTGLFTAGKSATYRVWGSFIVTAAVDLSGDYYSLSVQRNGVSIADQIQTVYSNSPAFKPNLLLPTLVQCSVGDVIRFRWYQTMNANRTNTASPAQNYIVIEEIPTRII